MAASIQHQLENNLLTVAFDSDELTYPLIDSCQEIFDRSFESGVNGIVLDFGNAELMDSPFIAMLMVLRQKAEQTGAKIGLVGISGHAGRVLESVRVRDLFSEYDSVEEAAAACRG